MTDINPRAKLHDDIRRGVRDVCRAFDGASKDALERSRSKTSGSLQTSQL